MKVVIIGAGKLGYKLAESLLNSNIEITVVDSDQTVINHIREYLDVLTLTANGIDWDAIKSLNIKSYDLLVHTIKAKGLETHVSRPFAFILTYPTFQFQLPLLQLLQLLQQLLQFEPSNE